MNKDKGDLREETDRHQTKAAEEQRWQGAKYSKDYEIFQRMMMSREKLYHLTTTARHQALTTAKKCSADSCETSRNARASMYLPATLTT